MGKVSAPLRPISQSVKRRSVHTWINSEPMSTESHLFANDPALRSSIKERGVVDCLNSHPYRQYPPAYNASALLTAAALRYHFRASICYDSAGQLPAHETPKGVSGRSIPVRTI